MTTLGAKGLSYPPRGRGGEGWVASQSKVESCTTFRTDVTKTRNGEWGMGNVEWGMGNVEWGMGNVEWGMGNGEWGMGNEK